MKILAVDKKKSYYIPEGWHDITVGQYMKLKDYDGKDYIKFLCILLEAEYSDLFGLKPEDVEEHIMPLLEWYGDESFSFEDLKKPKYFQFYNPEDKEEKLLLQKVPGIESQTFGQKVHFSEIMQKEVNPIDLMPYVLAIYFYPLIAKTKFDRVELPKFVDKYILNCRITEAYPIVGFFLENWLKSIRKRPALLSRVTQLMN